MNLSGVSAGRMADGDFFQILSSGMRGRLFCCLYCRGVNPVRALNRNLFFYSEFL